MTTSQFTTQDASLAEREQLYRTLVDHGQALIWTSGVDMACDWFNQPWLTFRGRLLEEELGSGWTEGVHPDDLPRCLEVYTQHFKARRPFSMVYRLKRHDGVYRWIQDDGAPRYGQKHRFMGFMGHCLDVTERVEAEEARRELERQLLRTQKMESLGSLAGGLAHDMNNVLGAILGLAGAHQEQLPPEHPVHRALQTIEKACLKGRHLVKGLLDFARRDLEERRPLDLNALIGEVVRTMEGRAREGFTVLLDLDPELRNLQGDPEALAHALTSLCNNAFEAMPDGGSLAIRTRNLGADFAELEVSDSGPGMSREVQDRAMEPFFSTRPTGSGLGLPVVYGTVKAHGGTMELHSAPGEGTRVLIQFPAKVQATPRPDPSRGDQRPLILLVDDDELVLGAMEAQLDILGYQVETSQSGEEALERLGQGLRPDVVILDMNMPGLGGAGTLPRLRAMLPDLPVLLATGWADQRAQDLAQAHPGVSVLSKPFTLEELQAQLLSYR